MKPVYSPEVAQGLDYQKCTPEIKDWLIGFGIVVVVLLVFVVLFTVAIHFVNPT